MRKPKIGEVWKVRIGRTCIILDHYDHNAFALMEARLGRDVNGGLNFGWVERGDYDASGHYVRYNTTNYNPDWDLIEFLFSVNEAPKTACNHDYIASRNPSKGSQWCKLCGEYK